MPVAFGSNEFQIRLFVVFSKVLGAVVLVSLALKTSFSALKTSLKNDGFLAGATNLDELICRRKTTSNLSFRTAQKMLDS